MRVRIEENTKRVFGESFISVFVNEQKATYLPQVPGVRMKFEITLSGQTYFLKVSGRYGGASQTEREANLLNCLPDEDKKFFLPVIQSGTDNEYDYMIQESVDIVMKHGDDLRYLAWKQIKEIRKKYSIDDLDVGYNWGFVYDKPVIFDVGIHYTNLEA